ncbi:aromatic ring-hydroxylating oxygenase subunit alpha [Dactylosporangium sp. CA-092794]|uniref:aromatic ring-hydroxylating oxygenase subunit alpha n=1 Tax=Dactylosporangium sp. CA-092794 TaxID=3239929 RepID=UPI003D8DAF04
MTQLNPARLVEATRVHRLAYVDPGIFALELDRVYGAGWVYLAHDSQLPEPDTFVRSWLGTRPLLVTRGRDGAVHALLNRCRHRAVTLATRDCGSATSFRCEYHGWTYRNTGELTGVPYPRGYGDALDKSALGLGKLRVERSHGFIFGTLAADPQPLPEYLGPAADALAEWSARSPTGRIRLRHGARRVLVEANWKVVWDNAADGYHPAFTHRSLLEVANRHREGLSLSHFDGDPDDLPMRTYDYGNGHALLDQRPSLGGGLWSHAKPVPGVEAAVAALRERYGDEAERWLELAPPGGMNLSVFPNLLVNANFVTTLQPLSPQRSVMHEHAVTLDGVPAEVNWLRLRFCEDFVNFGEPDDIEMWERAQHGYAAAEMEWNDISRGSTGERAEPRADGGTTVRVTDEAPIRSYWRLWQRQMSADTALVPA